MPLASRITVTWQELLKLHSNMKSLFYKWHMQVNFLFSMFTACSHSCFSSSAHCLLTWSKWEQNKKGTENHLQFSGYRISWSDIFTVWTNACIRFILSAHDSRDLVRMLHQFLLLLGKNSTVTVRRAVVFGLDPRGTNQLTFIPLTPILTGCACHFK